MELDLSLVLKPNATDSDNPPPGGDGQMDFSDPENSGLIILLEDI